MAAADRQGDHETAARLINAHLIEHPDEGEAWLLIAEVRHEVENWASAISACRRAMNAGSLATANKARLMSATIYQDQLDDNARAIPLLRSYIRIAEKVNEPAGAVRMRLAKGLMAVGRDDEASAALDEIIEESPRSKIAEKARRMKRKLSSRVKGSIASQKDR